MSNNNWSRWYREGTVSVTNGSKIVTGSDTYWLSAGLHAGDIFSLDGVTDYEIDAVSSNTQLTLTTAYSGSSSSGESYSIVRNFTATLPAEIAAKTAGLIGDFTKYIDTDMQSIHGKSAYEVAKANGYVGTEAQWLESITAYGLAKSQGYTGTLAQWLSSLKGDSAYTVAVGNGYSGTEAEWLESLKADNEWTTLNTRTQPLTWRNAGIHNSIYRGQNLGSTFTEEQQAAIRAGTFDDMWLGDYWRINGRSWAIGGFDYYWNAYPTRSVGGVAIPMARHNVALVSGAVGVDDGYWDDNQTLSAYIDSNYYVNLRPVLLGELEGFFGEDHIHPWLDYSYTCDEHGNYTGFTEIAGKCELMTLRQVTGESGVKADGTRQYLANVNTFTVDSAGILPLFRVNPAARILYNTIWRLRDLKGYVSGMASFWGSDRAAYVQNCDGSTGPSPLTLKWWMRACTCIM